MNNISSAPRSVVTKIIFRGVLIYIWSLMIIFAVWYIFAVFEKIKVSPFSLFYLNADYYLGSIFRIGIAGCAPMVFSGVACFIGLQFSGLIFGLIIAIFISTIIQGLESFINKKLIVIVWLIAVVPALSALAFDVGNNMYWETYRPKINAALLKAGNKFDGLGFYLENDGSINVWWWLGDPVTGSAPMKNAVLDTNFNIIDEFDVKTKGWLVYRNEEYGFEIRYPNSLFLGLEKEVALSDGNIGSRLTSVELSYSSSFDGTKINNFTNGFLLETLSTGDFLSDKNIASLDKKSIQVDNTKAVLYDIQYQDGSTGKSIEFLHNGKIGYLNARFKGSVWQRIFDEIIPNFRFLK